jgi:carboxyl-terminal processing protease
MAQEFSMKHRGRLLVLAVSLPVIVYAVVGGFIGKAVAAREDSSYQALRIFEDVVTLILDNYVEEVNVDKVMSGAMHGLADGLDPDSSYLEPAQVRLLERNESPAAGATGLALTRQYYLRVIAARDGSPAAKAGLQPGDYVRAIDGQSTRDTSVLEGMRLLRGKPGTTVRLTVLRGNAVDPHEIELAREELPAAPAKGRMADATTGLVRIAEFTPATADQIRNEIGTLTKSGAQRIIVDVRGVASGDLDTGLAAARLFVSSGTLAYRQDRGKEKEPIAAAKGDGALAQPLAVLTDNGTSGAAEVFVAALAGNKRATVVGERTGGRAARQKLVKLPDGSGLMLTHLFYLTPAGATIHEKGLVPDVGVAQPEVDFGQNPPTSDPILERALHVFAEKKAA